MESSIVILLFLALFIKHFVVTFVLQTHEHLLQKTCYWSWVGVRCSAYHIIGTVMVLTSIVGWHGWSISIAATESVIRHHVDWVKANVIHVTALTEENLTCRWWLMGFDQWLHCAIYIGVVLAVLTVQ